MDVNFPGASDSMDIDDIHNGGDNVYPDAIPHVQYMYNNEISYMQLTDYRMHFNVKHQFCTSKTICTFRHPENVDFAQTTCTVSIWVQMVICGFDKYNLI